MNIKSRLLLLLFDVFCVIYSYDNIKKNSLFIHYCIIQFIYDKVIYKL